MKRKYQLCQNVRNEDSRLDCVAYSWILVDGQVNKSCANQFLIIFVAGGARKYPKNHDKHSVLLETVLF